MHLSEMEFLIRMILAMRLKMIESSSTSDFWLLNSEPIEGWNGKVLEWCGLDSESVVFVRVLDRNCLYEIA
jgi:hypothetical protein